MKNWKQQKNYKKYLFSSALAVTTLLTNQTVFAQTPQLPKASQFSPYYAIPDASVDSKTPKSFSLNKNTKIFSSDPGRYWIPVGSNNDDKNKQNAYSGRVSSIAIREGKQGTTIFTGTANGGVWSSSDGEHWKALTDNQSSLSIGSVTIDPNNPNILYAGTGEQHFSADSRYGRGILKSTDGGKSWSMIGGDVFSGVHIGKIAVDPFNSSNLWVAADNGLWQSTDSGETWSQWYSGIYDMWPLGHVEIPTDVYLDSHSQGVIYMSLNNGGLFKSTDGGQNFIPMGNGTDLPNYINDVTAPGYKMNNVSFAVVEGKTTTEDAIYAAYSDQNGELIGIYFSKNGGDTWVKLDNVPQYFDLNFSYTGLYDAKNAHGQGFYDNVIAVDPTDSNHILAGGVTLIETRDGGKNWVALDTSFADDTNQHHFHPSQHTITFDSKGNAFIGNDGGIYEKTSKGKWINLNSGLNTLLFNPGITSIDHGKTILAGSQEHGTLLLDHNGNWQKLFGGNGGFTYMDPQNPQVKFVESQYGNIVRQTDTKKDGNVWNPAFPGYVNNAGQNTASYLTPYTVRALSGKQQGSYEVLVGAGCIERSYDNGMTYDAISPNFTFYGMTDPVTSLSQSKANPNIVYAGTTYGQLFVSFNAESSDPHWTNITPFKGDWMNGPDFSCGVSAIAINPSNPREITVTYGNPGFSAPVSSNHVFWTSDTSSPAWSNISENLPSTLILSAAYFNNSVVVGTEQGVFIAKPGLSNWTKLGSNLPNAPVTSIVDAGNGTLVAGTYGRGMFKLQLPSR